MSNIDKNVTLYTSIDKTDADTILCQYAEIIPDSSNLFRFAQEVQDSHENEIQFELLVSFALADWLQSRVQDQSDHSGIFESILLNYKEKTGFNV